MLFSLMDLSVTTAWGIPLSTLIVIAILLQIMQNTTEKSKENSASRNKTEKPSTGGELDSDDISRIIDESYSYEPEELREIRKKHAKKIDEMFWIAQRAGKLESEEYQAKLTKTIEKHYQEISKCRNALKAKRTDKN